MTFEWKLKCICQNFLFDDSNIFGKCNLCPAMKLLEYEEEDWNAACCNDNNVQFLVRGKRGQSDNNHSTHFPQVMILYILQIMCHLILNRKIVLFGENKTKKLIIIIILNSSSNSNNNNSS